MSIFRKEFVHWDGSRYQIEISCFFDANGDPVSGQPILIEASKYYPESDQVSKVKATIGFDLRTDADGSKIIYVLVEVEGTKFEFPLANRFRPALDLVDSSVEALDSVLPDAFENILEGIPVPEPALGCVIKAGIISVVGQVIRCNNQAVKGHHEADVHPQRIRKILVCLRENGVKVAKSAAFRTLKCWVTAGFS